MAKTTDIGYRNQIIYSVFVRNHTKEGTFEGVRKDVGRIRALGADIIWLLPIHPIGERCRKGTLGSPYAIRDYRAVNPEYGIQEDFERLVEEIHKNGMKCIIDVVYNHTSPDSWLAKNHPEWFYHKPDGSFGNKIGDWWDVIDLDYGHQKLWDYQIETLAQWAKLVDGFRCDVAPLVPLDFWLRARREVEKVRPGCLWLCESVEPPFITGCRSIGMNCLSDGELFQAFDIGYEYDIFHDFTDYLEGKRSLREYAESINRQEAIYPANYVKLRFLENHDRDRTARIIPDERPLINWTAFLYFQKGTALLYGGQERMAAHRPGLFDKDPINWDTGKDLTALLKRLAKIKKDPIFTDSSYAARALPDDILYAEHRKENRRLIGIFSMRGTPSSVSVDLPDGQYRNMLNDRLTEVKKGKLSCDGSPVIMEAEV